jgi:hypothetical protein
MAQACDQWLHYQCVIDEANIGTDLLSNGLGRICDLAAACDQFV